MSKRVLNSDIEILRNKRLDKINSAYELYKKYGSIKPDGGDYKWTFHSLNTTIPANLGYERFKDLCHLEFDEIEKYVHRKRNWRDTI
jgi:hypothetical protein